ETLLDLGQDFLDQLAGVAHVDATDQWQALHAQAAEFHRTDGPYLARVHDARREHTTKLRTLHDLEHDRVARVEHSGAGLQRLFSYLDGLSIQLDLGALERRQKPLHLPQVEVAPRNGRQQPIDLDVVLGRCERAASLRDE